MSLLIVIIVIVIIFACNIINANNETDEKISEYFSRRQRMYWSQYPKLLPCAATLYQPPCYVADVNDPTNARIITGNPFTILAKP